MAVRVLLVSPRFHGYWRAIASALERHGVTVHTHVYDSRSMAGTLHHKLAVELPQRAGSTSGVAHHGERMAHAAVAALRATDPDVVLTIKGDALGPAYWEEIGSRRGRSALWLYDELRRTRFDPVSLPDVDLLVSYSRLDVERLSAAGRHAEHLPLAFDHTTAFRPRRRNEVAFVGARYESRTRLLEHLHASGVPVRAYGRDWSRHLVDRLRTWDMRRPSVPSDRDLSRAEAYGVFAGASACINTHHDQDGFTMRTFEIPGAGGTQLIDRADVAEFYEPGSEVLVFDSADELVEVCQRVRREPRWSDAVADRARRRTLAHHTFDHRMADLLSFLG